MTQRFKDKDPADVVTVAFDFTAMAAAVTLPEVTCTVAEGTDPAPGVVLQGAPSINGAVVLQRVKSGLNGATYALQCLAYNGADRYSIEALLPVRSRPAISVAVPVYLTEAQFEQRFSAGELADLLANGARFADAENDAAGMINGYLSSRYPLPLASVPTMVVGWAADVTRYKLWSDRAPEEIRRRYEDALAQLKLLAQGTITLPPGSVAADPVGVVPISFGGYAAERVFTGDTLAGY